MHDTKSVYIHDVKDRANKNNLIYPDNKYFQGWEMFMTLILLLSCILTPVEIAFAEHITPNNGVSFQ